MKPYAIITGASRGIGKCIAYKLASEGINLRLCCEKNMDALQELASELTQEFDVSVSCKMGDLSREDFVISLFEDLPRLDYLVNNAGISHIGLLQDTSLEEWNRVLSVNLTSCFLCCKEASKKMISSHSGRILNISSMWGQEGASMETAYSASKGGVDAFTKALAKELAPSGISVNAISFGFMDTEMNNHLSKEEKESFYEEIPMGRPGSPKEAADYVYQTLTAPPYLTGQIISFNGGIY